MSYKGIYRPSNPRKYKGDSQNIIYRSLWERKFMNYCDLNENILEWASEEFWIPYLDPTTNRVRRYFPDFFIKYDFIFLVFNKMAYNVRFKITTKIFFNFVKFILSIEM